MLADWFAERGALLRVADCGFESGLPYSDRARGDVDASDFERAHQLLEAGAFDAADQIYRGHGDVFEQDFAGVDSFVAQLVEIAADGGAAVTLLDREHADARV